MSPQRQVLEPFIRQNAGAIALAVGTGLLNSIVTLLLPLSLGRFYERLFGGLSNRGQVLNTLGLTLGDNWSAFFALLGGLIVLRGLLEYGEFRLSGRLAEAFGQSVREKVFAHQLALPLTAHRQKEAGKYLLRYAGDFQSARSYLRKGLIGFTKDVLFVGLALATLYWLNASLTGLLLVSLLPFLLLFRWVNRRIETRTETRRDQHSSNVAYVASRLSGMETIKVFNREAVENEQFRHRSEQLTQAGLDHLAWRSVLAGLLPTTVYALVFIMLIGVHQLQPNGLSRINGAVVITFILLVLILRPVLRRLLRVGTIWRSGSLSLVKVAALLNQTAEHDDTQPALVVSQGHIAFESVNFAYAPGKPVLADLTFSAKPGTITRLAGGTGKTTVFNLLLRLVSPIGGTIYVDGQDISTRSVQSVRKHLTLVSTDVPLLGRTVFETVSYSRKPQKRPRAQALLDELQTVADVSRQLTLDDRIGERGMALSNGQRTVLRLVRALLTRKPILLLDEPFAGLSEAGAYGLGQWLNQRARRQTILLATSRPVDDLAIGQTLWLATEVIV